MSETATYDSVNFGSTSIALAALSPRNLHAMVQRGLNHYHGNEQSSRVTTWKDKFESESKRAPTDEEIASQLAAYRADALDKLLNGEVGARVGTPRGTALDTIIRRIALKRATTLLVNSKLKMPGKDEVVTLGGQSYTREDLIERQVGYEKGSKAVTFFGGKTVREEAEAEVRATERAKAKAAEAAPSEVNSAEDIGL